MSETMIFFIKALPIRFFDYKELKEKLNIFPTFKKLK